MAAALEETERWERSQIRPWTTNSLQDSLREDLMNMPGVVRKAMDMQVRGNAQLEIVIKSLSKVSVCTPNSRIRHRTNFGTFHSRTPISTS